jgi:mutator protein MutT
MHRIDAAIAIVLRDDKLLVCQRRLNNTFGGCWEFPGGKCEEGESLHQCLMRELREELDIVARPIQALSIIEHDYAHASIRLHPFICQHVSGEPTPIECEQARWIEPTTLSQYTFPPANEGLLDEVISYLSGKSLRTG